jgi:hypothetical protein
MKIRPVGAELFHADEQTDRHDEANSFAILRKRLKLRRGQYLKFKPQGHWRFK